MESFRRAPPDGELSVSLPRTLHERTVFDQRRDFTRFEP